MGSGLVSSFVFQPPTSQTYDQHSPQTVIQLNLPSGKITNAHFLKSNSKNPVYKETIIIYSHGNATDIGETYSYLQKVRNITGCNIFSYDYVGYGLTINEKPTESLVYEAIESAMKHIMNVLKFKCENIIVYGTSLGTGASVHIASKFKNIKGLILESPFTSILRTRSSSFIGRPVDMFENYLKIGAVTCPVFYLHGKNDTLVPWRCGLELFNVTKYRYPPKWIDGAGHNDMRSVVGLDKFLGYIKEFVDDICTLHGSKSSQGGGGGGDGGDDNDDDNDGDNKDGKKEKSDNTL